MSCKLEAGNLNLINVRHHAQQSKRAHVKLKELHVRYIYSIGRPFEPQAPIEQLGFEAKLKRIRGFFIKLITDGWQRHSKVICKWFTCRHTINKAIYEYVDRCGATLVVKATCFETSAPAAINRCVFCHIPRKRNLWLKLAVGFALISDHA